MKKALLTIFILSTIFQIGCGPRTSNADTRQASISGQKDSCDDPDADIHCCFINMPATLTSKMIIDKGNDPGEKLVISGRIFKADGITPYPDVILYAYHTDHNGYYSKKGNETGFQKWHGHLHGWCKSDSKGYYEIHSIRPAPYPNNTMPAHIHAAVKTDKGRMFYINDFVFKDDSLVNPKYLSSIQTGENGVVNIKKTTENAWVGKRDIILIK